MGKDDNSTVQTSKAKLSGQQAETFERSQAQKEQQLRGLNQARKPLNSSLAIQKRSMERQMASLRSSHQRTVNQAAQGIAQELAHIERERGRIEAQKERLRNTEQNHLAVQRRRFARGILVEQEHLVKEKERFERQRSRTKAWQDRIIASRKK